MRNLETFEVASDLRGKIPIVEKLENKIYDKEWKKLKLFLSWNELNPSLFSCNYCFNFQFLLGEPHLFNFWASKIWRNSKSLYYLLVLPFHRLLLIISSKTLGTCSFCAYFEKVFMKIFLKYKTLYTCKTLLNLIDIVDSFQRIYYPVI